MNRNGNMNAILGDYLPEIQPGPNAGYQQDLMQKQFPQVDPQQVEAMAEMLKQQGDHESAYRLLATLGSAGVGIGGGLSLGGAPIAVGGPLMAAGGLALGAAVDQSLKAGQKQKELADERAKAYPGSLGSF